jgi:hypothetical protein
MLFLDIFVFLVALIAVMVKYNHHRKLVDAFSTLLYTIRYLFCNHSAFYISNNKHANIIIKYNSSSGCCIRKFDNQFDSSGISCQGGHYTPFFRRPIPIILDQPYVNESGIINVNLFGRGIPIFSRNARELWINVTNNGKTPIKRLRARAKIVQIPHTSDIQMPPNKSQRI